MYEKYGKRVLDLLIATIAMLLLFIPMALVALIIKLNTTGPIFFRQIRYGKNKKLFSVYKFRTMSIDAPANIPTNSFEKAGDYITRSGKFMRKFSIDELPQLINVLKGEMSIVGPRPVVTTEKVLIQERAKQNANSVKPGITGWAQVNGRDELDDIIKARMDGQYVEKLSIITDIRCLLKTIVVILTAAGHSESHGQTEGSELFESTAK